MKGKRQKYVEYVVRRWIGLVMDLQFYLLLPDADEKIEETFFKLKSLTDSIHNQLKPND
jgi:hypothetical protein